MNHSLLKDLPHISRIYHRMRYKTRLYKSSDPYEVRSVLAHGVVNGFLDDDDVFHIYVDADQRVEDREIVVADWIMTELGPIISEPGPVDFSLLAHPFVRT